MFGALIAHLQEDTIVCIHAAYGTVTLYESSWWPPRTLIESDSTICCMYTVVSSWRWSLKARNM